MSGDFLQGLSGKFSQFVVKKKWWLVGLFIVLTAVSCGTITLTKVNYDLSQYLPKNSDTNKAMTVLKEEFDDKGMLYVLVQNLTSAEIEMVQSEISSIEGIASVVYDPRTGFNDADGDGTGDVLLTVTFKDYDASKGAFDTTERLENYLEDKSARMTGQSAYTYYTREETFDSIIKIGIVIVLIILVMLFFTSRTYFELVPMILVFGVSVVLNMGTNWWFNGISYVSNLVALVLQLALSIDYSVILLHRFMEEKEIELKTEDAAIHALAKAVPEILSSSLTTIAGLASLLLMTLPIGVEIGIALGKSIVCSLLSVIFLMPALLVICQKPLEKTKHKNFVPNVTRLARALLKGRLIIVPLFIVIIILSAVGQSYNSFAFNMNGGSMIVSGQQAIKDAGFGTLNTFVVIVPSGDYEKERALAEKLTSYEIIDSTNALSTIEITDGIYLTDSFTRDELTTLVDSFIAGTEYEEYSSEINGILKTYFQYYVTDTMPEGTNTDEVSAPLIDLIIYIKDYKLADIEELVKDTEYEETFATLSPYLSQLTTAKEQLQSEKYSRLTFNINSGIEDKNTFDFITKAKKEIECFYPEYYCTGESVVCYEMAQSFPLDNMRVSICIVCFVLFILLFMFKNLALPVILVLAIQGGMWINFVIPFLAGSSVSFIGYLIISAIQMGATIDYAIVLTNRYLTTKHEFPDRLDAMAAAENAVFPTVITSGIILTVTGFTLGLLASGVVASLGMLMGIGAAISMGVVIFILPSLLLVTEGIYTRAYFKDLFRRKNKTSKE